MAANREAKVEKEKAIQDVKQRLKAKYEAELTIALKMASTAAMKNNSKKKTSKSKQTKNDNNNNNNSNAKDNNNLTVLSHQSNQVVPEIRGQFQSSTS